MLHGALCEILYRMAINMSKAEKDTKAKKNTKNKITGFDILYKVVTAVLALAVFPVTYFMNLIYYALDWTDAMKIINSLENVLNSENILEGLKNLFSQSSGTAEQTIELSYGHICLAKFDEFKSLINMASNGQSVNIKEMLFNNAGLRPLVISLALFTAVLVIALVILIVAIVKNKPKITAALSAGGVVLGVASYAVFTARFANPLVNGTTTLAELIGSDSLVLQMLGKVFELRYDNAFFMVLFIMIAILVWSLAIIVVNSDDKTEKALREAKKADKKAKKAKKQAKKAEKEAKKANENLKKELKQAEQEKKEQEKDIPAAQ